jgi:hypothetical protein
MELGMKWRGLEQMVREVMDQQFGLLKQKFPISERTTITRIGNCVSCLIIDFINRIEYDRTSLI